MMMLFVWILARFVLLLALAASSESYNNIFVFGFTGACGGGAAGGGGGPSSLLSSRSMLEMDDTRSNSEQDLLRVMSCKYQQENAADAAAAKSTKSNVSVVDSSRRSAVWKTITASISSMALYTTFVTTTNPTQAALAASSVIKPGEAYQGLLKGRDELITAAKKYLPSRDFEGMRTFLAEEAVNINNFEANAQGLLESKRLDIESKKEIGTIRRYGVGADVMIMYGGLRSELDDNENPNAGEVRKYLTRTLDSLQEVIVICQNNGF